MALLGLHQISHVMQNILSMPSGESPEAPISKRDKLGSADEAIAAANATLAATDPNASPDIATPNGKDPQEVNETEGAFRMDAEQEDRDAERRQSNAAAASRSNDEASPKEAGGSMREYRNDLEYLEDSFKLMIILLR